MKKEGQFISMWFDRNITDKEVVIAELERQLKENGMQLCRDFEPCFSFNDKRPNVLNLVGAWCEPL